MLSAAYVLHLSRQLTVSTDVVGYPIFADYNVDHLKGIYYAAVLFFPIASLLLYLGLSWLVTRVRKDQQEYRQPVLRSSAPATDRTTPKALAGTAAMARVLAMGAGFGLGATIALGATEGAFWVTLAAVASAYGALVVSASLVMRRVTGVRRIWMTSMSRVNVLASPFVIIGVIAASASSRVTVASDGSVHQYSWLPLWAGIALMAAAFGLVYFLVSRARSEPELGDLERRVLLFLTCPVALFLLLSGLPGPLGPAMDMFHDGEGLAAARLTMVGYFPWRDLMSIHGFFQDVVTPLVGMQVFETSRWGAAAGIVTLLDPLAYVFLFVFISWLFRRSWLLVLSFVALILGGKFLPLVGTRFMFVPLVLLLLATTLERGKWWLGAALGCVLAVQAVFVPETAYVIVAIGLVVILHDYSHRQRAATLLRAFSTTGWCIVGGSAVFAAFGLVLLSQHAVGDYLFYFTLFAPNRGLAGGIPLDIPHVDLQSLNIESLRLLYHDRTYLFFAFAAPAALVLGFLYYASKVIRRRPLDTADWVIGSVAIFSLLYYEKFLERSDLGHAQQVYQEAVPLIAFLVYRTCTYLDGILARWQLRRRSVNLLGWQPVAVAMLLIAAVAAPGSSAIRFSETPAHFSPVVANPPQIAQMGYTQPGIDLATYTDIDSVLKAYLHPGDWVFDFSNEPGLYYYLLNQNPRTRYYHVSMADPEVGQKDLISELERDQPKLVVFTNSLFGLPEWDGIPNAVRHYDVSQYILDHYTPLLSTHTQILYGLSSANLSPGTAELLPLSEPVLTDSLAFRGYPCDWGYAPNFLSISPPASVRALEPVTLSTAVATVGRVNVTGWAVDLETGSPDSRLVLVANGVVIGEGEPTIDRPDVAQFFGKPGAVRSGFAITASIAAGVLSLSNGAPHIQVFGVSASGVASELGVDPNAHNGKPLTNISPVATIGLAGGSVIPVRPGPSAGNVESIDAPRYQIAVSPPPGGAWSDYQWLEIDAGAGFRGDHWSLTDVAGGDSGHDITFGTLDRSPARFRVHVGSCAQWHGYAAAPLFLSYSSAQAIAAVRLLP